MEQVAEREAPVRDAGSRWAQAISTLSAVADYIVLTVITAGYALYFGWLSLERYWTYQMHALDMGNMAQAAWNTVHGHPFFFTTMRLPYAIEAWNTTTRLSFHVEALFPIISVVYVIWAHPESLLVLQTAAIALGAVPTYFLARDVLGERWLAIVFALGYLLYPTVEALNLYEFHAVALAPPLLIAAFLFMRQRRWILFAVCCFCAMGTKEEIGLVVAMFGLYAALVQGDRQIGLVTILAGAAWSLTAALVIERHFRHLPTVTYMRSRYGYLCPSPRASCGVRDVVHKVTHDPGSVLGVLFVWPKLGYLLRLLAPLGFMAVLAPAALLLGLPTFVLNLFSQDFHMYTGLGDNSAELVAVVVIASILGTRVLIKLLSAWLPARVVPAVAAAWIVALALSNQVSYGFTVLGAAYQSPAQDAHQRLMDRFVAMIPDGVPVSTQDQLEPHLASRHYAYLFEDIGGGGVPLADYILLDATAPAYPLPSDQLHDMAVSLLASGGWGVAAASDGLILLKRSAPSALIGPGFYAFAYAGNAVGSSTLSGAVDGLKVLGYDRARTDLPNHVVPTLRYTFYFRTRRQLGRDIEPVVYETMGGRLIGCVKNPLGLAWLPTSQWQQGQTYQIRMDPLETHWNEVGTAALFMELRPMAVNSTAVSCESLWATHGRVWNVGTLDIGL